LFIGRNRQWLVRYSATDLNRVEAEFRVSGHTGLGSDSMSEKLLREQ
jgi:hypothetical protein